MLKAANGPLRGGSPRASASLRWVYGLGSFMQRPNIRYTTTVPFSSKDIAILQCFKSNCLHAFDRTLFRQSQLESSFTPHATSAKHHSHHLCAPLGSRKCGVLWCRLHTRAN